MQHSHKRPGSSFTHPVYFIFSRENSEFEAWEKHLEKKAPAPSLENVAKGWESVQRREHRAIKSLLARGKGCKSPSFKAQAGGVPCELILLPAGDGDVPPGLSD